MIRFNEDENGRHLLMDGSYEENILCLRGILVSLSEQFGISFYELLEYAVMSEKEEGKTIENMDVVFQFAKGNTHIMHLSDLQQKAVKKIVGVSVRDGELICADDFLMKDGE